LAARIFLAVLVTDELIGDTMARRIIADVSRDHVDKLRGFYVDHRHGVLQQPGSIPDEQARELLADVRSALRFDTALRVTSDPTAIVVTALTSTRQVEPEVEQRLVAMVEEQGTEAAGGNRSDIGVAHQAT
jgi:hypothetical protein